MPRSNELKKLDISISSAEPLSDEETAAAETLKQEVPELANMLAGALLHREQE